MRRSLIPVIALLFAFPACREKHSITLREKGIYVEHKIHGEEGSDFVTVLLQFRQSQSGRNELVQAPGSVQLDGQPLQGDSSAIGGGFYELRLPLDSFEGLHIIRFEDDRGNISTDSFQFKRFSLPELSPLKSGKDWKIVLRELRDGDRVMVALTDTAFQTNDIVQVDTVRNGGILLPASKLDRLQNGPLHLELSVIQSKSPRGGIGGSIEVDYSLKRYLYRRD